MQTVMSILIILVLLVLVYLMWRALLARGFRRVVAVFRENKALNPNKAKTLEAMGLEERKGLFGTAMFTRRDYRQTAMRILGQERIIKMTEGPKFYLDEDALRSSRVKRFANIQ
jgi:hypothetical protein